MKPYEMQNAKRELTCDEVWEILEAGEYCVISGIDPEGMPYGVPMSYVIMNERLYVHTSKGPGHKFDCWHANPQVSIAVATEVEAVYIENNFSTRFASAIARGTIRRVDDVVEVKQALVALCMKYLPEYKHEIGAAILRELDETAIWVVDFEEVRGKAGRRLKK